MTLTKLTLRGPAAGRLCTLGYSNRTVEPQRTLTAAFTVLFLFSSSFTYGDEPRGPADGSPSLTPVFSDDFSTDTRGNYAIERDVSWDAGKLTLAEGASISREINGGAWTTVKLRLEQVQLTTEHPESELRVWLRLDGATDCYVRLRQELIDGQAISSIALVDTGEKDGQPFEQLVRELAPAGIELRDISVDYRQGRAQVTVGGEKVFSGYISNGTAKMRTITVKCSRSRLVVKSLSASASKPKQRNYTERYYTATDRQQLTKAATERNELIRLYRAGKFAEAAKVGERVLVLHKSVLGEKHPEYGTSLNNLALLYQNMGDYARAEPLQRQALEIHKLVLGEQHPEYATSLSNLAALYQSMGDNARAEPIYRQAVEIWKSVLGEHHPKYATSLGNLATLYQSMGDYARAEPLQRQALEINKSVLGEQHPGYARSLGNLALLYQIMGDHARAVSLSRQVMEIRKSVLGEQHPHYAMSLNNLAMLFKSMGDYARAEPLQRQALEIQKSVLGEQHPDYARSLGNLALLYQNMGDYARAEPLSREAMEIRRSVLGEQHPNYASSLDNLAVLYEEMGDYARAEPLSREAMEIRKSVLGEHHTSYATSLNNLAMLYQNMGDYPRAELLQRQAIKIRKSVLGEQHPSYATSLSNLAVLYQSMGDYARAESLHKQALEIDKSVLGEQHPNYATSLNNLAMLYEEMGDYARAEPLLRQTLETQKSVLGEQHPNYAISLNNLAMLYKEMGDYARAEPLQRQAMEIRKSVLGEQHPDYATSLGNLATLYTAMGDYARAEPLQKQATEILKSVLGEQHLRYGNSLANFAALYQNMGDYARAEPIHRQAMAIRKSVLGNQHPDYASGLNNLAMLYQGMGNYARAEPIQKHAMDVQRGQLNTNATVQSARQQNRNQNKLRFYLDNRFATAIVLAATEASSVAADLWAWKGAVTARQQAYRKVAANPNLAPLFAKLQSVTRQLSAATGAIPTPPAKSASETTHNAFRTKRELWGQRVAELTREREDLEQQIAAGSLEFRRITEPFTAGKLQTLLPTRTAFIDFLEYRHGTPDAARKGKMNYERRYLAVVVTSEGPVRLVGLGSADVISDAIASFRRRLQPTLVSAEERQAAAEAGQLLRKSLWLPMEEHLDGIHTVIISPDSALGTLPFAALPGKKPSGYLLEDYRIAMLPMANQILSLFGDETPALNGRGLLVVGDVDYTHQFDQPQSDLRERLLLADSSIQREADQLRSGTRLQFASLPGFRRELDLVEKLFQSQFPDLPSKALSEEDATEEKLLKQSANARILHLITHGYFSDPSVKSISQAEVKHDWLESDDKGPDPFINTYLPGLLSGLAMAGANNPSTDPEDPRDGILRASEIEASSLQGVDLVVLSACETGLGKVAGGEGLTGLQRAFHVAGARSVIASLWKVDDAATTELMRLFYTNLWEKKMSKIDALRDAQLTMLNRFDIKTGRVRGLGGNEGTVDPDTTAPTPRNSLRTDPRYWAAFQLSGDWR